MSSTNNFAPLANTHAHDNTTIDDKIEIQKNDETKREPLEVNQPNEQHKPNARKLANIKITPDVPIKKLVFCEVIKSLMICFNEKTGQNVYGNAFWNASEYTKILIDKFITLYDDYCGEFADNALWERCFVIYSIKGDDLPVISLDSEQRLADMNIIIKTICGQIRLISTKQLIISKKTVGNEHYNLQNEIDDIVLNILGNQGEIVNDGYKIITEPLVDEYHKAHHVAKEAVTNAREARLEKQMAQRAQVIETREKIEKKRQQIRTTDIIPRKNSRK